MDPGGRSVRSRTSSTSSLRSPRCPATPAHTPNTATLSRGGGGPLSATSSFPFHNVNPDQLAAGLTRVRAEQGGSRSSSIPPTPAPTPNPLLQVNHHMVPEQLVAGIKNIRHDEGFDSNSQPATPAPSPFCPSPAQVTVFCADQVAEGIQRLREESGASALSGASSGQPPTPSTTPGPGNAPPPLVNPNLGIIPELLQESIDNLKGTDEGLESTSSSPATPIQTPHSPSLSHSFSSSRENHSVHPEQLAAGIHRLKVEEGMSSGGSSGFPSTPAPTPFSAHPGGVRPEDLAAGISRLSVIEESGETIKSSTMASNESSQPNLSQYFGNASEPPATAKEEFFDNFHDAMMQSCRESKIDLTGMGKKATPPVEAEIVVTAQATDDERSLQRRQSQEDKMRSTSTHSDGEMTQAFSNVTITPRPTTLPTQTTTLVTLPTPTTTPSLDSASSYATPVAPTPVTPIFQAESLAYSTYVSTTFTSNVPITSPLPMTAVTPSVPSAANAQISAIVEDDDSGLSAEAIRERDLWIASDAVRNSLSLRNVDRSMLTSAVVQGREEIQDPIRNMVLHYRGEAEAAKRSVLTANDVSQDINGLNQLIRSGCSRAAVNLTARLLTGSPFSNQHSPSSLRIWQVRIALLLKLKQFTTVETEAAAFGSLENNVDLYYDYYPEQYGTRQGSMVPFGFRVLLAELPLHVGKPLDAMDRLYSLLASVEKILLQETKGSILWLERKIRVLYALANCCIQQKDYELASKVLDQVHDLEETRDNQAKVRSIQGRMFLQLGDLVTAMTFFDEAAKLRPQTTENVDSLVDKSCLSIASNNYAEALDLLTKANEKSPSPCPVIINNMSVCLLYLGRLKEALSLLESNLTSNPEAFLQETQVLNLATLYELESSYAGQKKQSLLDLLSRHAGDGVNTACLKF